MWSKNTSGDADHLIARLTVNVNKVATLRNSRGGAAAERPRGGRACASRPARRASPCTRAPIERHITPDDVRDDRARLLRASAPAIEYNIEGDPRPDLLDLVDEVRAGSVHARAGRARRGHEPGRLAAGTRSRPAAGGRSADCAARGIRVSLFVDAGAGADPLGRVDRRRSRRALHRAVRARVRARPRTTARRVVRHATPRRRRLAHALGARRQRRPRSRSRQSRAVPRRCRTSTRSRSATRSCRARCLSASRTVVARVPGDAGGLAARSAY